MRCVRTTSLGVHVRADGLVHWHPARFEHAVDGVDESVISLNVDRENLAGGWALRDDADDGVVEEGLAGEVLVVELAVHAVSVASNRSLLEGAGDDVVLEHVSGEVLARAGSVGRGEHGAALGVDARGSKSVREGVERVGALNVRLVVALKDAVRAPEDVWAGESLKGLRDTSVEGRAAGHAGTESGRRERLGASQKSKSNEDTGEHVVE